MKLPQYAAITSKGGAPAHFAIKCRRVDPIWLRDDIQFDIGLFRNFMGSDNIAYQQPAPIVEPNRDGQPRKIYRKGFWADLLGFANLTRGRTLAASEANAIRDCVSSDGTSAAEFKALLDRLKAKV